MTAPNKAPMNEFEYKTARANIIAVTINNILITLMVLVSIFLIHDCALRP